MLRRLSAIQVLAGSAVLLLFLPVHSFACRCEQLPLAQYYEQAAFVAMARLVRTQDETDRRALDFELIIAPHKGGDSTQDRGSGVRLYSQLSTASCGIQPDLNAIYVVFGRPLEEGSDQYWVDSCSGTRVHISSRLKEPVGFMDVPAKFVAGQLNALHGLDVLRDVSANAPSALDPKSEKLIGLLDLKALAHGGHTNVYGDASRSAEVTARINTYDEIATREYGYEQKGAVVFARLPNWYRVQLVDGAFGWIAAEDAGTWFPYEQLPIRRLAYLTGEWSGLAWPSAGAGIPVRADLSSADDRHETPAEVLESILIGGFPWFRVKVLKSDPCSGGDSHGGLEGWVPAYGQNGKPNVWFHSRGC